MPCAAVPEEGAGDDRAAELLDRPRVGVQRQPAAGVDVVLQDMAGAAAVADVAAGVEVAKLADQAGVVEEQVAGRGPLQAVGGDHAARLDDVVSVRAGAPSETSSTVWPAALMSPTISKPPMSR